MESTVNRDTLPPIIRSDSALEAGIRDRVRHLAGACPGAFLGQLIGAWCVIAAAIALAVWCESIWVSLLAIFIIGTRQNLLGLLVHEQVHRLGLRNRFGDLVTNLTAAYPLLVLSVEGYARVHLAHHKYFYTDKDPDYNRKSGLEWSIPMPRKQFLVILLSDITGLNVVRLIRGKKPSGNDMHREFQRRNPAPAWVRVVFWLIIAGVLFAIDGWKYFFLYWMVPILTVTQCLVRLGALSEHKYNVSSSELNDSTHLIVLSWWEKLLLPNLNFTLHHYHHMYPGLAFSALPVVHRMYVDAGLVHEENILRGYGDFFRKRIFARDESVPASLG